MDELARAIDLPQRPTAEAFAETTHARLYVLAPGAPLPEAADVSFTLPDGSRFAYAPRAPGGPAQEVAIDPMLRGNAFKPLHQSPRALSALLSLAASRRVDTGPESERVFLFLRGTGLVSLENNDVIRFNPNVAVVVPAGEPARVWCQGPEDALAVVLQPQGMREERRTLAGEIAKRRVGQP